MQPKLSDYHWKKHFLSGGRGDVAFTQGNGQGLGQLAAQALVGELRSQGLSADLHSIEGNSHYFVETPLPKFQQKYPEINLAPATGKEIGMVQSASSGQQHGR